MLRILAKTSIALLAALPVAAQEKGSGAEPAGEKGQQTPEQAKAALLEHLKKAGIEIDLDKGTLTVPVVFNRAADPLEYLLINRRGKSHEAMFVCEVKPSLLNAAFLLLGFRPGKNASFVPIEPPPSQEEIMKGAPVSRVVPPKGMELWMTAQWKGQKGKSHEVPIEDLIFDLTTQKAIVNNKWIYLGGRMAQLYRDEPEVFIADYEGNLVSTCYMSPDNHLVTVSHERGPDDENWWYTELCPPPGTKARLTFYRKKPKLVADREARLQAAAKNAGKKAGHDK